ncbi:MAG: XdhC family protein [Gemmatimonadaceae bacterium]
MRELDRIRRALADAHARGQSAMLVTVLGVQGSVYRGAGARMVVVGAESIGAVSGGCLEADIIARSPDVIAARRAEVARYDTRASDDVVLGLGLGCQGVIDVLLEPLEGDALGAAVAFYDRLASAPHPMTLVTVVRGNGVGTRLVLDDAGAVVEGDEALLARDGDVVHEEVRPATRLLLCGAGADAMPLAQLAHSVGFHVTVVDHRPAFLTAERFPDASALVQANLSQDASALGGRIEIGEHTRAVVMAHSAVHDRAYLHAMLDAGAGYIGVLGPRRRTMELLGARAMDGELPANVHAPVGLDLGAESPEEIALAIIAEIAAVNAGREGGLLRDRRGPIHERDAGAAVETGSVSRA